MAAVAKSRFIKAKLDNVNPFFSLKQRQCKKKKKKRTHSHCSLLHIACICTFGNMQNVWNDSGSSMFPVYFPQDYFSCCKAAAEPTATKPWRQAISPAFPSALKLKLKPAVPFQGSQTAPSVLQGWSDSASTPSLKYAQRCCCGRRACAWLLSEINSNIGWNLDATHDTNIRTHTEKGVWSQTPKLADHLVRLTVEDPFEKGLSGVANAVK